MDYAQLVKRLRWTAASDEQVFDAETAMLAAQAIQTLQTELEQAKAQKTALQGIVDNMAKAISKLKAERKQLKAERDAQSNGIHKICKICLLDKYYDCARRIKEG